MGMSASSKLMRERIETDFTYHPPTGDKGRRHEALRGFAKAFAIALTEYCPESRELSLALTKVEEASMWGNAAIARND
jgi:hypothetical protein